jgi:hypothetical protein
MFYLVILSRIFQLALICLATSSSPIKAKPPMSSLTSAASKRKHSDSTLRVARYSIQIKRAVKMAIMRIYWRI